MKDVATALRKTIDAEMNKAHTHSVLLGVQTDTGSVNFAGAAGNAHADSIFHVASITKMYTATLIMQLADEGLVDLDSSAAGYLPDLPLDGIHVYKGIDYSRQITIRQLLNQTSGLADYYEAGMAEDFLQNRDSAYEMHSVLNMVRQRKPAQAPGGTKAFYSDTNYQLLGAVVESVANTSLVEQLESRIFGPLQLSRTRVFHHADRREAPVPFYNRELKLSVPLALSSMAPDGGIVSTTGEVISFLKAYFNGELFRREHFDHIRTWHPLFFPMKYGEGLWRFHMPRWMNSFTYAPELIGHSGSTGAFAFYEPRMGVYMAGTINQVDQPSRPFRFMTKALGSIRQSSVLKPGSSPPHANGGGVPA